MLVTSLEITNRGSELYLVFVGTNRTIFRLDGEKYENEGMKYQIKGVAEDELARLDIEGRAGTGVFLGSSTEVALRSIWIGRNFRQLQFGLARFWTKGLSINPEDPIPSTLVLEVDGVMALSLV